MRRHKPHCFLSYFPGHLPILDQIWIPSDGPKPPGLRLARVEISVLPPVPHYCSVMGSTAGLRKDVLGDPKGPFRHLEHDMMLIWWSLSLEGVGQLWVTYHRTSSSYPPSCWVRLKPHILARQLSSALPGLTIPLTSRKVPQLCPGPLKITRVFPGRIEWMPYSKAHPYQWSHCWQTSSLMALSYPSLPADHL